MNKFVSMLVVAVVLGGCTATQSNVVCDGTSKSMTCHARTATECVQTNQKGSSHGMYVTDESTEKAPTQLHRPISFKE